MQNSKQKKGDCRSKLKPLVCWSTLPDDKGERGKERRRWKKKVREGERLLAVLKALSLHPPVLSSFFFHPFSKYSRPLLTTTLSLISSLTMTPHSFYCINAFLSFAPFVTPILVTSLPLFFEDQRVQNTIWSLMKKVHNGWRRPGLARIASRGHETWARPIPAWAELKL